MTKKEKEKIIIGIALTPFIIFYGSAMVMGLIEGFTGTETTEEYNEIITETTTAEATATITTTTINTEPKEVEETILTAPVCIEYVGYEKDYCGGIDLTLNLINQSEKSIKYVNLYFIFYNAVGDVIYNEIGWCQPSYMWKYTGPLEVGEFDTFYTRGFYNTNFKGHLALDKVHVIFMDDTEWICDNEFEMYYDFFK